MVHAALLLLMLEAVTTDLLHHQPEAQHPKSLAINKNAGRLPHLSEAIQTLSRHRRMTVRPGALVQRDVGLLNNGGERLALLAGEVCKGLAG
jgi:hypothetical protein